MQTVALAPVRTQERRSTIAAQLEEAFERGREQGWAEHARQHGLPVTPAARPGRHLAAVAGGAR